MRQPKPCSRRIARSTRLKARGGYVTADVIDVTADTPNLDTMLAKFNREHWHDEDEVRFIIAGRGLFHIHPNEGPVFVIEVEPGDLIRVPRGTKHWFDLCAERRIRAIRLFQDQSGWTPRYTDRRRQGFSADLLRPVACRADHLARVTFSLAAAGVGVVLLDIEGTTTPIEFVHRTLFSFARAEVRNYLTARIGASADAATVEILTACVQNMP